MPNDIPTTSQNSNLSAFKEQLHSILQKIDELDDNDKTEALTYVRKFIEIKPNIQPAIIQSSSENIALERKGKTCLKRQKSVIKRNGKTNLFKCTACVETRETKRGLLKHMEFCHIGTPISCIKCRRTLNSSVAYDWHIEHLCRKRRQFSNGVLECPDCFKVFTLLRTYNIHMKAHKRNNCFVCNVVLTNRVQLADHMLEVHKVKLNNTTINCYLCGKGFAKHQSLYHHLQQHYPLKIICNECGYINGSKEEYNEHSLKHQKDKHWECSSCSDKFSRRQQYFQHMKNHDHYKCLTCDKTFASKKKVYLHKKNGHTVQGLEPKFHCPYCPATFHRSLLLQKHAQSHKDKNVIACKFCKKIFSTKRQYFRHCMTVQHKKKDPEVGDYICGHCGIVFTQKFKFNNHLRRYHGSKAQWFSCSYCEYQTHIKANFERHKNLHFNEGNMFICNYCGKNFSSLAVLTDHIQYNHVQERKFKCDKCNHSFKRKNELTRHSTTHSDLRPHVCQICDRAFKRLNHLHRHETTVHSMVHKTNQVQRLKIDSSGAIVPISPTERDSKSKLKNEKVTIAVDSIVTSTANHLKPIKHYSIPIPEKRTSSTLNNEELWFNHDLEQLPTTNNDLQISASIDDLLINSLICPTDTQATIQSNRNIPSSIEAATVELGRPLELNNDTDLFTTNR